MLAREIRPISLPPSSTTAEVQKGNRDLGGNGTVKQTLMDCIFCFYNMKLLDFQQMDVLRSSSQLERGNRTSIQTWSYDILLSHNLGAGHASISSS
eukprot:84430-Pelagomonas_calceolata.AAC.1